MKRVLIFSLAYYPTFVGGAEVAIKEITDRITDIEFHMVTLRMDGSPRLSHEGRIVVHRIGFGNMTTLNKLLFQFLAAWKAIRLHRREHYDAVWAVMAHSAGIPAALFKYACRVPYVLNLQEGDSIAHIERRMRPLWPLFTRSFTTADVIQPLSTFLAKWARIRGFKGPIEIIPQGVDSAHFMRKFSDADRQKTRAGLGVRDSDLLIITTSRLVMKNAIDDVIRALSQLPAHMHFVVYGSGPDEESLKELAREQGVGNRVHFEGYIGREDMPHILSACDIFIRPSRSEGFGISFIEAMAAGLPVIATQEGGIADFLFDEKRNPDKPTTGWAVDKNSPEQIAEAVKDIIAHPEKVRAVTATAQHIVKEKYDWNIIARDMREKVFGRILQ